MNEGFQYSLSQLKNIAWLWYCDLLHVHWKAGGIYFSDIHGLAKAYYEMAFKDVDYFAEKAISKKEDVSNGANIGMSVPTTVWQPEDKEIYDIDAFMSFIRNKGNDYIEALRNCSCEDSDVKSDIDLMLNFWTSEVQYKNDQRIKPSAGAELELGPIATVESQPNPIVYNALETEFYPGIM